LPNGFSFNLDLAKLSMISYGFHLENITWRTERGGVFMWKIAVTITVILAAGLVPAPVLADAERNREVGEAFLDSNSGKDNVTVTASGLQYLVLVEGKGAKPKSTDSVTVHYMGTLVDGTVFDSSYDRGEPATFPLEEVIPGWTEGLQLMNVGSKYRLFIPSELGYGERGAGLMIGPDAVLIFDVELLGIE
jgi:FKBP-type peptidyl-prolyl cis-trans isomerase